MRLGRPQRQDGHLGQRVGLDVAVIQFGEEPRAHRDLDLVVGVERDGGSRAGLTGGSGRPDAPGGPSRSHCEGRRRSGRIGAAPRPATLLH